MLNHDEVKAAYVLKPDLREDKDIVYRLKVVPGNVRKNSVAVQEPPWTKRYFFAVYMRRTDPEGVINKPALLITDLLNERARMTPSCFFSLASRVREWKTKDLGGVFRHFSIA